MLLNRIGITLRKEADDVHFQISMGRASRESMAEELNLEEVPQPKKATCQVVLKQVSEKIQGRSSIS